MSSVGPNFKLQDYNFQVKENKSFSVGKSKLSFSASIVKNNDILDTTKKTIEISARKIGKYNLIDKLATKLPGRVTITVDGTKYSVKASSLSKKFGLGKEDVKNQGDVKEKLGEAAQKKLLEELARADAKNYLTNKWSSSINFDKLDERYKLDKETSKSIRQDVAMDLVNKLDSTMKPEESHKAYVKIADQCGLPVEWAKNTAIQTVMKNSGLLDEKTKTSIENYIKTSIGNEAAKNLINQLNPKLTPEELQGAYSKIDEQCGLNEGSTKNLARDMS